MSLDLSAVTITQLTYATAVARHRHFGKAAEACAVTQPTLSMQVKKLEETLDVILFDRSRKPVEPTEIGKGIIHQAVLVLQEVSRIEDIIHSARGEIRGDFHLGIIPTLSPYLLPRFLDSFSETYPAVTLFIEEMQTHEVIHRIGEGHIDAGLLATPTQNQGLIEQPLFFEPFYVFASPGHAVLKRKTVNESDLSLDDIWLLTEGHCLRNQTLHLCELATNDHTRSVRFEAGSLETLIRMVEQGSGYTLVPQLAAEFMDVKTQDASLRRFRGAQPGREISIVYNRAFLKRGIIDALATTIAACLPASIQTTGKQKIIGIQPPGAPKS